MVLLRSRALLTTLLNTAPPARQPPITRRAVDDHKVVEATQHRYKETQAVTIQYPVSDAKDLAARWMSLCELDHLVAYRRHMTSAVVGEGLRIEPDSAG